MTVTRKVWMCKAIMIHRARKMIIYASSKRNIGRKTKLAEKDKRVLKFIDAWKHKQWLYQKTSEFKIISRIPFKAKLSNRNSMQRTVTEVWYFDHRKMA